MNSRFIIFSTIISLSLITSSCRGKSAKVNDLDIVVDTLSSELKEVQRYIPPFAVVAHRGSTYWTPEETEVAYLWARNMGADYLESDLQISKDGVILSLHDDNLKRTTNIEEVYGENIPQTRLDYYITLGYSPEQADSLLQNDISNFKPYLTSFYTYQELLKLDAGIWFNKKYPERAQPRFEGNFQYISTLEDQIMFARGKRLKRNNDGSRKYAIKGKTGGTVTSISGTSDVVKYLFEYENDPTDNGNRPGIYIEFKERLLNPKDFVQRVYNELDRLGMNIITKPETKNSPFYTDKKVNVLNTNGKVILQSFSLQSLQDVAKIFEGKVPMCLLLWKGDANDDLKDSSPSTYAKYINMAVKNQAHIIGPSIAGEPNNYEELNEPWMFEMIKQAGLLDHPYSFDTEEQMEKYAGNTQSGKDQHKLYLDGMFTNRTDLSLQYMIKNGYRSHEALNVPPDAKKILTEIMASYDKK